MNNKNVLIGAVIAIAAIVGLVVVFSKSNTNPVPADTVNTSSTTDVPVTTTTSSTTTITTSDATTTKPAASTGVKATTNTKTVIPAPKVAPKPQSTNIEISNYAFGPQTLTIKIELLKKQSNIGFKSSQYSQFRKTLITKHYLLIYSVKNKHIVIHRLKHTSLQ